MGASRRQPASPHPAGDEGERLQGPDGRARPEAGPDAGEAPIDAEEHRALLALNCLLQAARRELCIQAVSASGEPVIQIVDAQSGEVIRRVPRERVLALVQKLGGDSARLLRGLPNSS